MLAGASAGLSAGFVSLFGSVQGVVLAAILMTGCETGFLGSSGGLSMILVRSRPPESFTVLVLSIYWFLSKAILRALWSYMDLEPSLLRDESIWFSKGTGSSALQSGVLRRTVTPLTASPPSTSGAASHISVSSLSEKSMALLDASNSMAWVDWSTMTPSNVATKKLSFIWLLS